MHYPLCLKLCLNPYSLCHAFLAVPAVPLGLPLQVEHAWPRCVAVPLGGLHDQDDGDSEKVRNAEKVTKQWF